MFRGRASARLCAALVLISILGIGLVGTSCSQSGKGSAAPSFDQDTQEYIQRVVNGTMSDSRIPGAVVGIWVPEQGTFVEAFGQADIEIGQPMETSNKVRIASITKTFVATVILQLVDEGVLGLDETIEKYLPQVPNGSGITIRELLNHSSGIYDYEDDEFIKSVVNNPLRAWAPEELLQLGISKPPYFPPGSGFHYSNTNYIALGMIIEKTTGKRLGDEIRERIIEPLGLANTEFPSGPEMTGQYAHGYTDITTPGLLTDITVIDMSWDWAAGAMISNLDDLQVWAEALATGQLISKKMHEESMNWVEMPDFPGVTYYGLGITDIAGFVGHSGLDPGYNSAMYYLPDQDATIIVIFNYCGFTDMADLVFTRIAKKLFSGMPFPF
jgi:D-alanyl-D-alanine carboxypeptidase